MKQIFAAAILLAAALPAAAQDQQIGARTKAMGGSYTAFEDDPVSVWLNPAGIATQSDGMAIAYQSSPIYELSLRGTTFASEAEMGWTSPAIVPTYLGMVFQLGTEESPQAVGICFATPFRMKMTYFQLATGLIANMDQTFYRFRAAYSRDFRFRAVGEEGFFPHLSVGIGTDLSVSNWSYSEFGSGGPQPLDFDFNEVGVGAGAGILVGLYDNTRNFKVNLGAAYQSKVGYDFSVDENVIPILDWPNQVNAGLTVYLFDGLPLRLTLDAQWIEWDRASSDPPADDLEAFEDILNYSAGVEFRIRAGDNVSVLPRAGVRRYDAPWDDPDQLPFLGSAALIIDTDDDVFTIVSGGLGLAWTTEKGAPRAVDIAADYGGDAPSFAMSFTMGF